MTKKNRLRELTKRTPATTQEIEQIIDLLHKAPDLEAAVTAAALAETGLDRLIKSRIKPLSTERHDRLFGDRGPMGSFSSKILVAETFGLITSPMAKEFDAVRNIRNAFAHSRYPLTFDDPIIEAEIASLKMTAAIRDQQIGIAALTSKACFVLTVRLLFIITSSFEQSRENAEAALEDALNHGSRDLGLSLYPSNYDASVTIRASE